MSDLPASLAASEKIASAIARLRSLTQQDLQQQWRWHLGEWAIAEATDARTWDAWTPAPLNDRQHIAWSRGRQVLWLGQRVMTPATLAGYPLVGLTLRVALTWWAESADVFVNGQRVQVGDLFDCSARILLAAAAQPGEAIDLAIRLVSPGHDDGALVRSQLIFEALGDESRPEPGFVADELTVVQGYLSAFRPEQEAELAQALGGLAWEQVGDRPVFDASLVRLRAAIAAETPWIRDRRLHLLGHAHLDLAWLWPIPETWEAAERTFQSALDLQRDYPELLFGHSSPALYAWLEANRPELFAAIQAQVRAGRWEIIAGLWVEPEFNEVSGESIARQVLYGQRYTEAKFGQISRVAWLPDSFGFCWQLPQIFRQGGIDYFVTQKLRWNDTTQFPHGFFRWRSPDGTEILSWMSPPIGEATDPVKMGTYARDWEQQTGSRQAFWLPGVGDHGGGPTRDMLEVARRWTRSPLFPQIQFTPMAAYLDAIAAELPEPLPQWQDELYLEFHRGCYTSHADQKLANRRCEQLLYQAELFASLASWVASASYPQSALEQAWKQVLFNQFHDILPGSSIPEVFEEANQSWATAAETARQVRDQALQAIAAALALPSPPWLEARPIVVFNALNWSRAEMVTLALPSSPDPGHAWQVWDLDGQPILSQVLQEDPDFPEPRLIFAAEVPALGYRTYWLRQQAIAPVPAPAETPPWRLSNEFLQIDVDPDSGDLQRVFDKAQQREVLSGPGNQLQAFRDRGQYWDAWNIDPNYEAHPLPAATLEAIAWIERGPLRQQIRVQRRLGDSIIRQDYILDAGTDLLKIASQVDWRDRQVLLKAAFPLAVESDRATYEIPFGAIERPTRPQTSAETAKWEVPALHWADLSQDDYGVSLLNDCKYGYDARPSQLRLSLLRSPNWPDPNADRGQHRFTYALYPHRDRWQSARTVHRGHELNQPLQALLLRSAPHQGTLPPSQSLLPMSDGVILSAFKRAEDGNGWILRCYEAQGSASTLTLQNSGGLAIAQGLDILERSLDPCASAPESPENLSFSALIQPWQIATFRLQNHSLLPQDCNELL